VTAVDSIVGTPLYWRPKSGATRSIGYAQRLIRGRGDRIFPADRQPLFELKNLRDVLMHQVKTMRQNRPIGWANHLP